MLISLLITWFITATSLWIAAKIVPGVEIKSYGSAFWVAIIFSCFNVLLGWFFWTVLTLASLGLALLLAFVTRFIVNAILLKVTAAFTESFEIEGFLPAVLASIIVSASASVMEWGLANLGITP